jgi:uncharacterized protein (TIGR02217 family)
MIVLADTTYPMFPECPGFGFTVEPRYLTKAIEREGGQERVDRRWDRPLVFFTAVPTGNRDADVVQNLLIFWHAVGGTGGRFRFKDWTDYKSCKTNQIPTALDQPFEVVGGAYQMIKRYVATPYTQNREICRPVGSTIVVANTLGAIQTDWILDESTGLLTPGSGFTGTPGSWGGEFDLPCRFLTEYSLTVVDGIDIQSGSFTLSEYRPDDDQSGVGRVGGGVIGGGGGGGGGPPLTPPPGAVALGYTRLLWSIVPALGDVSPNSTPLTALYASSLTNVTNTGGLLTLVYNGTSGVGVSSQRQNSTGTAGTLAHLRAATGFYVQSTFKLSSNNADHWPAFFLEPSSHFASTDQLVGAPAGYEAWMEVDVVEAGFSTGPLSTVIDWKGYFNKALTFTAPPTGTSGTVVSWPGLTNSFHVTFSDGQTRFVHLIQGSNTLATWTGALTGTPTVNATASYGNTDYNNYGALGAIDWTQPHVFGVSIDPVAKRVQNWVDGVATFAKDVSGFPAQVLTTDNYFVILDVVSHGAHIPYNMVISSIQAWGP